MTQESHIDDLRAQLAKVIDLRRRAMARLKGPPSQATRRAARIAEECDRKHDRLVLEIKNHPDYEGRGSK